MMEIVTDSGQTHPEGENNHSKLEEGSEYLYQSESKGHLPFIGPRISWRKKAGTISPNPHVIGLTLLIKCTQANLYTFT